jgi:hypothetical protein
MEDTIHIPGKRRRLNSARLGVESAESDNKETGALRCIFTASGRCTLLTSVETKRNETIAGRA